MRHLLLPCLGGLLAQGGALMAAELPIVRVTIGPGGAVVERAGTLPPGDEVVGGLPLGLDPDGLALTVEGLDTPPAVRLELPVAAPLPPPDPAWQARLAAAQAAFDAAQPALDLGEQRAQLARSVLALFPRAGEPAGGAPAEPRPLPGPALQQALLRFVGDNLAAAAGERSAALQARAAARAQLIALDEERERQRPLQVLAARLPLPGAGGRQVRLRYAVERAAWAPVYRIEVAGGSATLVHEALIDVPRDQAWTQGRLELVTRHAATDLLLRDLQVPVLELGDEVVTERPVAKRRAVGRGGGSKGSESAVDCGLRAARRLAAPDGSWPAGAWTAHATALNLLIFLGAGYDHKTPGRYRATVELAVRWLSAHDVAGDLPAQALAALALAEAAAMGNDAPTRASAERALAALAERVAGRHELEVAIYRRGPFAGPELLAWTTMAAKSAQAAGLEAEPIARINAVVDALLGELDGHADRDEAQTVRLVVEAFRGRNPLQIRPPPVSDWLERLQRWLQEGRPELVYFATLGLFQYGGDAFAMWNTGVRDRLVVLNAVGERNGWLAASPYPAGEAAALAMLTLPLECYYRYKQVAKGGGAAGLFANRGVGSGLAALPPLPALDGVSEHWPVRIDAGPARLVDGQRVRVVLGRTALPGRIGLRAAPADGPGAWRVLASRNPLAVPLLGGEAEVVVEGERLGAAPLPFTEPGRPLELALGRDERVQVARSEERSDDEAWGKRTRTTTVTYRIDAPAGLYDAIRIDEAMPVPQDGSIQLVSLQPALAGAELDRRLVEDPVWHVQVDLRKPPAQATVAWQLRHPASVRAQVKARPAAVPAVPNAPPENAPEITVEIDPPEEKP